jgi:hypothetical protein
MGQTAKVQAASNETAANLQIGTHSRQARPMYDQIVEMAYLHQHGAGTTSGVALNQRPTHKQAIATVANMKRDRSASHTKHIRTTNNNLSEILRALNKTWGAITILCFQKK